MTPEKLISYLHDPSLMKDGTADELWALVKEYPYFQIGRMLLAKHLHDTGDSAFPLSLRLAAAYAGNRSILKKLIEGNSRLDDETNILTGKESLNQSENKSQISTGNRKADHTPEIVSQSDDNIGHEPVQLIQDSLNQNPLIENILNRLSSYDISESYDEPAFLPKDKVKTTFTEKPAFTNELVEKFLRDEPRISQPRKEFFNPEDNARQSTSLPDDVVSETLAQIYEKQGYYSTAIKIYNKLMLLIPEKSSYFAGRIDELNKKRK